MVATSFMNVWVTSRRNLALQNAASILGSTIQQSYFSLNQSTVPTNTTMTDSPGLPTSIEGYTCIATAALQTVSQPPLGPITVLQIKLNLQNAALWANTSVLLGSNVVWQYSTFISNSPNAYVTAQKLANYTISLRFGS
jgi:hypothetical protein